MQAYVAPGGVDEGPRLDRIVKQLEKLYDALEVVRRSDCDDELFQRLHEVVEHATMEP